MKEYSWLQTFCVVAFVVSLYIQLTSALKAFQIYNLASTSSEIFNKVIERKLPP